MHVVVSTRAQQGLYGNSDWTYEAWLLHTGLYNTNVQSTSLPDNPVFQWGVRNGSTCVSAHFGIGSEPAGAGGCVPLRRLMLLVHMDKSMLACHALPYIVEHTSSSLDCVAGIGAATTLSDLARIPTCQAHLQDTRLLSTHGIILL